MPIDGLETGGMKSPPACINPPAGAWLRKWALIGKRTLIGTRLCSRVPCALRLSRAGSVFLLVRFIFHILQIFCELVENPFQARRGEWSVLLAADLAADCNRRTGRARGID